MDNLYFKWTPHPDVVNADVSIVIYYSDAYGNIDYTIYDGLCSAISGNFFYTIPYIYFRNAAYTNYLYTKFGTSIELKRGDSGMPHVKLTDSYIKYDTTGQTELLTYNYVTLSKIDGNVDTVNSVLIDRTEYYGNPYSLIFWDSSDVSLLTDITNAELIYDNNTGDTSCVFPDNELNPLKVLRLAPTLYGGIDGVVHIDTSSVSDTFVGSVLVYIDYTNGDYTMGEYLGEIKQTSFSTYSRSFNFDIPASLMTKISDNNFVNTTLNLINNNDTSNMMLIYDSYILFKRVLDNTAIYTDNTCYLYDSTTPIHNVTITTENRASVKAGKAFIIDYYTPTRWWNLSTSDKYYTHTKWNTLENISQSIGRFYNSPYVYKTQLPKLYNIKFRFTQASPYFSVIEDVDDFTVATTFSGTDSSLSYVIIDDDNYLTYSGAHINPYIVTDDGTTYRVGTYILDNTVALYFNYNIDGTYYIYEDTDRQHPFVSDHTFYLSFYGKKRL